MKTALVILCILTLAGCDKQENSCTPSSQSYTVTENKAIDTSTHEAVLVSGNHMVFKFQYNYEQCPGVVGAALSREIYFEIPEPATTQFSYANESLQQANALVYLRAPVDPRLRLQPIVQGSVHGTKISPSGWHITASLVSATETISFEAEFVKAN